MPVELGLELVAVVCPDRVDAERETLHDMVDEVDTERTFGRHGQGLAERLSRFDDALTIFQRYLALSNFPADQAAGLLWEGKCQQMQGKNDEAKTSWQQAAQRDRRGTIESDLLEPGLRDPLEGALAQESALPGQELEKLR